MSFELNYQALGLQNFEEAEESMSRDNFPVIEFWSNGGDTEETMRVLS